MKRKTLLYAALLFAAFFAACGDDDPPIDDNGTGTEIQFVEEIAAIIGGPGAIPPWDADSIVWVGKKWYQAPWDATLGEYGEEEDITDEPDYRFTEHEIWFKNDKYNTDRFKYPVGKGRWTDPYGKSGFYYEMDNGNLDTLFVNRLEAYPPGGGRQDWVMEKISKEEIIFVREWRYGSKRAKDRFVWVKK